MLKNILTNRGGGGHQLVCQGRINPMCDQNNPLGWCERRFSRVPCPKCQPCHLSFWVKAAFCQAFRFADLKTCVPGKPWTLGLYLVFLRCVQWKYLGQNQLGKLNKNTYSCVLPQTSWIGSPRKEKGGRVPVFSTSVPRDSESLWILAASEKGWRDRATIWQ